MKSKNVLSCYGKFLVPLVVLGIFAIPLKAQVSLTSQSPGYSQNFNGLSTANGWTNNATITGWYATPITGSAIPGFQESTGGNNLSAGLKSFGVTNDSDRGLGSVSSTTDDGFYYGLRLQNNTGKVIKNFRLDFKIEMWAKDNGNFSESIALEFIKGTNLTNLKTVGWTAATIINPTVVTGGGGAAIFNGNTSSIDAAFGINDLDLPDGQEILIRWSDEHMNKYMHLAIDDVVITTAYTNVFYIKPGANPALASSWVSNPNGTGTSPASFNANDQTFIIDKATTISTNWIVSGTNSKLVVGDGTNDVELIMNGTYSGTIDVADHGTLTINSTTTPVLGTLADFSTVNYNSTSSAQTVPDADYGNLTIGNGHKKLKANTRVRKNLNLNNARLELDDNDLFLDANATITGGNATAFIVTKGNGRLKRQVQNNNTPVVFPVGTDRYMPVTITQNTPGATDYFSVKAIDGVFEMYTNNVPDAATAFTDRGINKTWIIDEETAGGSDVTITIQWNQLDELPNFDPTKARLVHFENGAWDSPAPVSVTYNANGIASITRSGITSFSPYGVDSRGSAPLPVDLISFTARFQNQVVVCNWQTATELNNEKFAVERSLNGKDFSEIGMVKGKGNAAEITSYMFTDARPVTGTAFYRLRQTDFDGTTAYSKIVAVKTEGIKNQLVFDVYPNPARQVRYLTTSADLNGFVQITITNLQGQVVSEQKVSAPALKTGVAIDLKNEPKGLYFITVNTGQEVKTIRTVQL